MLLISIGIAKIRRLVVSKWFLFRCHVLPKKIVIGKLVELL